MGRFGGHALPGSFFMFFSLYYTARLFVEYYKCQHTRRKFVSIINPDCSCCCWRLKTWPLDAFLKLFLLLVASALELYTGLDKGSFYMGNGQHITMYMVFCLAALVDILKFYKAPLPKDLDYLAYAMAFTVEGVLFKFHLHGRNELDVLVHTLLIYAIGVCVLGVLLEMRFRHSIAVVFVRNFGVLLQGTWFWQAGFILLNPFPGAKPWDPHDHDSLMLATMYFCWHCGVDFVLMLLVWLLVVLVCRKRTGFNYKRANSLDSKFDVGDGESDVELSLVERDEA